MTVTRKKWSIVHGDFEVFFLKIVYKHLILENEFTYFKV